MNNSKIKKDILAEKYLQEKKQIEKDYKTDFPILKNIIYLDSAATTQKPTRVIDAVVKFYMSQNASTHSGTYELSEDALELAEESREVFAKLINAKSNEIIFTRNATDSINMLSSMLKAKFEGEEIILSKINRIDKNATNGVVKNIVTTEIEHNSNFVPWQQFAIDKKLEFRIAKYDEKEERVSPEKLVDKNTIIVAFTLMSNVTGLIINAKKIIKEIRKINKNTIIILDIAQAIAHMRVDIKELDADFACFSAHKIYGPSGVGILYGKEDLLEKLPPQRFGGNMVHSVKKDKTTWAKIPQRFEAGTANGEGIIASAQAIKYLEKQKMNLLFEKEETLRLYAVSELKKIKDVKIIGHRAKVNNNYVLKSSSLNNSGPIYGPVIAFTIKGIHPHDIATICSRHNVCLRAGHHCAQVFHESLKLSATTRISISFYNNKSDIDKFIFALKDAIKILGINITGERYG